MDDNRSNSSGEDEQVDAQDDAQLRGLYDDSDRSNSVPLLDHSVQSTRPPGTVIIGPRPAPWTHGYDGQPLSREGLRKEQGKADLWDDLIDRAQNGPTQAMLLTTYRGRL